MIGVLLDHHGEIMILGTLGLAAGGPSIFFTAVIYPVVKVHRRSGSATRAMAPRRPSCPLVGELCCGAHGSGDTGWVPDTRRRLEDQPANRRWSRVVGPGGRPGAGPGAIRLLRGLLPESEGFSADEGGGDEETRTPDPLLAKEMLCQLSYVPVLVGVREVVGAPGLEPETSALSGQRSNQLSYAPSMPASPEVRHGGRTVTLEEWQEQGMLIVPGYGVSPRR